VPVAPDLGIAISTDGVGTKLLVAQAVGRFDTVGIDCVAMNVNDVLCVGALPVALVDYIALEEATAERLDAIGRGLARGCELAGVSCPGGELAQVREMLRGSAPGTAVDLVGTAIGVVRLDRMITGQDVAAGDVLLGLESTGLHSNGYTLARKVLIEPGDRRLDDAAWPGADVSLGEELLRPSVIYSPALRRLAGDVEVHAFVHVTGGGIPGNLSRVLPNGLGAEIRRGSWPEPRIFTVVAEAGGVADDEMVRVFNLGLGMLAVVADGEVAGALASLRAAGHAAYEVGRITDGAGVAVVTD
jgi:phosphoribosylformylglycinamidine cyclo-ligase